MVTIGCSKKIITPSPGTMLQGHINRNKPAQYILDELFLQCLIVKNKTNTIVIVSLDLLELESYLITKMKNTINIETGIPEQNIMIACTHTHTGPPVIKLGSMEPDIAYHKRIIAVMSEAIKEALQATLETTLEMESHRLPHLININRRKLLQGKISMAPNFEGPKDDEVRTIRFKNTNNKTAAIIVNHATHPTTLGVDQFVVSSDYPGRIRTYLEHFYGYPIYTVFLNGACGDVRPAILDSNTMFREGRESDIDYIGREIAKSIVKTKPNTVKTDVKTMYTYEQKLPIHFEQVFSEKEYREMANTYHSEAKRLKAQKRDTHIDRTALALEFEKWANHMIELSAKGEIAQTISFPIHYMFIDNDIVIIGIPGELFAKLGIEIKKQSPFPFTLLSTYTNGTIGYIPTKKAYDEGGYEVEDAYKLYTLPGPISRYSHQSIVQSVLQILHEQYNRKK